MKAAFVFLSFIMLQLSFSVSASPRCECEPDGWVADCVARIELNGKWLKVISNTHLCSRVEWYIDGQPNVTIVTEGAKMEKGLGQSSSPKIAIQSCKVCRDSRYSNAQADNRSGVCEMKYHGGAYTGQCADGAPHGQGTMNWSNGDRYQGEWRNKKQNGQGTMTWSNGDRYQGEWRNGVKAGQGTFLSKGGERYQGEWRNDNRNGQGTATWPGGNRYQGEWRNSVQAGGVATFANGTACWSVAAKCQ